MTGLSSFWQCLSQTFSHEIQWHPIPGFWEQREYLWIVQIPKPACISAFHLNLKRNTENQVQHMQDMLMVATNQKAHYYKLCIILTSGGIRYLRSP